jgi:hypothetical protein
MKNRLVISMLFAAMFCCIAPASAEVALGIIVGEPTGLSIRINHVPVLGVAWSLRNNWMYVQADDWLLHNSLSPVDGLNWYLGLGGGIGVGNGSFGLGLRVPVGLQLVFERNWELFGELAPGIWLLPEPDFDIKGGIGIRYIF